MGIKCVVNIKLKVMESSSLTQLYWGASPSAHKCLLLAAVEVWLLPMSLRCGCHRCVVAADVVPQVLYARSVQIDVLLQVLLQMSASRSYVTIIVQVVWKMSSSRSYHTIVQVVWKMSSPEAITKSWSWSLGNQLCGTESLSGTHNRMFPGDAVPFSTVVYHKATTLITSWSNVYLYNPSVHFLQ